MNTEIFVKIAQLIKTFNEQNKKKPGHKTYVHIDSMDRFEKKENVAVKQIVGLKVSIITIQKAHV